MKKIIAIFCLGMGLLIPTTVSAQQSQPFVYKFGNSIHVYLTNASENVLIYGTNESNGQIKVDIDGTTPYSLSAWNVDHVFVAAYGGNDRISFGYGMEDYGVSVWGGRGQDRINAGTAAFAFIDGEEDRDIIYGTDGADILNGSGGRDRIYGYGGDDYLDGGSDNDLIYGGQDNDEVIGGRGKDSVYGDHGDDILKPGTGEAEGNVFGGQGRDTLCVLKNFQLQWISVTGHDYSREDYLHQVAN